MDRKHLKTERIRRFAWRARGYLCAYYCLHYNKQEDEIKDGEQISPQKIERLLKDFKTHCCVLDFELNFIVKSKGRSNSPILLDQ